MCEAFYSFFRTLEGKLQWENFHLSGKLKQKAAREAERRGLKCLTLQSIQIELFSVWFLFVWWQFSKARRVIKLVVKFKAEWNLSVDSVSVD